MNRKKILIIWLFGSIPLMLIAAAISMLVWNFNSQADPSTPSPTIDYFFSMTFRVPVGWVLSFLTPFGWANLLFLCLSISTKSPFLLSGSAIATILSGIFWPTLYVTMTGL